MEPYKTDPKRKLAEPTNIYVRALYDYKTDPKRKLAEPTNIYVRALYEGRYVNVDICMLDKESLLRFLRSRGGKNVWAENLIGLLLGHGPLHKEME